MLVGKQGELEPARTTMVDADAQSLLSRIKVTSIKLEKVTCSYSSTSVSLSILCRLHSGRAWHMFDLLRNITFAVPHGSLGQFYFCVYIGNT